VLGWSIPIGKALSFELFYSWVRFFDGNASIDKKAIAIQAAQKEIFISPRIKNTERIINNYSESLLSLPNRLICIVSKWCQRNLALCRSIFSSSVAPGTANFACYLAGALSGKRDTFLPL
jgi:hypothetical protein